MISKRVLLLSAAALSLLPAQSNAQSDWPVWPRPRSPPFLSAEADQCWQRCPAAAPGRFIPANPGPKASLLSSEASCTSLRRTVFLYIEPETGKQIWHFEATQVALRGLAYWPGDKTTHPRVFAGIKGGMIASTRSPGSLRPASPANARSQAGCPRRFGRCSNIITTDGI